MLNKYFTANLSIVVGALLSTCALSAIAADKTPKDMTCQEFISLNPQLMSPVAYWVYNDDEQFKGGDYVSLQETDTIAVPLTLKLCKDKPQSKIKDFKDEVKQEIKKAL
ncbi:acid-activated periplasmic chaperone HdeB [Enterobacteriaceae bacterium 89]|nr:acid-activated periplasmic chaperone HdeB [Enterobacteriaceae bacterium 89]